MMENLILRKLSQMRLVAFRIKIKILFFQMKQLLGLSVKRIDFQLNSFIATHLTQFDSFLFKEDEKTFSIRFKFSDLPTFRLTLRRPPSSDLTVFYQVFKKLEYAPLIKMIFDSGIESSQRLNIIDAGGNIGCATIYFKCHFPNASILTIEPDKDNFKLLSRTIGLNKYTNVKLIQGGIWYKDTNLQVLRDFRDGNDWAIRVVESDDIEIAGYTLDTLMHNYALDEIDILKIDVEGAEKEVFASYALAQKFLAKTKFISVEVHDEFQCRDSVYTCLSKNGFVFKQIGETTIGVNRNLVSLNCKLTNFLNQSN